MSTGSANKDSELYKELDKLYQEFMVRDKNQKTAVVLFESETLGEFVLQNVIAATMFKRFSGMMAYAIFLDRPDYRPFIAQCNTRIVSHLDFPASQKFTIPIDWFDEGVSAPVTCPDPTWHKRGLVRIKLLLVPGMLSVDASRYEGLAEAPPSFVLPEAESDNLIEQLLKLGLQKDRWIACLHMRDKKTGHPEDPRCIDPHDYEPVIRHIIDDLGGQVVRLGLKGETELPRREGFFDFTREDYTLDIQTAALSLSRFFLGTDAGLTTLASAFQIPAAGTNMVHYTNRLWNRDDLVLAKKIILPNGQKLNSQQAYRSGFLDGGIPEGAAYEDNPVADLLAVTDHLFDRTRDCPSWRASSKEIPSEKVNFIDIPPAYRPEPLIKFWT